MRNPAFVTDSLMACVAKVPVLEKEWDQRPFAVVGNNHNSNFHYMTLENSVGIDGDALRKDLRDYAQNGSIDQPTIMTAVSVHTLPSEYALGVVDRTGKTRLSEIREDRIKPGQALIVQTSSVNGHRIRRVMDIAEGMPIEAETAQQLADYLFDRMGSDAISTAAALWSYERDKWALAVRNAA